MNGKGDKWRGGWSKEYENNHNKIFKKEKKMKDWEKLFEILQVLNPESDMCKLYVEDNIDKEINTERWEDICYYMDTIKPEEEE